MNMSVYEEEKKRVLLLQLPQPGESMENISMAPSVLKNVINSSCMGGLVQASLYESSKQNTAGDRWLIRDIVSLRPHVIGFTAYIWNIERILYCAKELKQALPHLTIIAGGPESAAESPHIAENPSVDFWVFGEGEEVIVDILQGVIAGSTDFSHLKGIAYWDGSHLRLQKGRNICRAIDSLPAPYLCGDIREDEFPRNMLFTSRGCVRGCKYCCWSSRGVLRPANMESVRKELELFHRGATRQVVIYDSAFNESPLFFQVCELISRINSDNKFRTVCFISPDTITEEQAKSLARCRMATVEIGLQSANRDVCRAMGRVLDIQEFIRGVRLLKQYRITFLVDIILGLPLESPDTFRETIDFLKQLGAPYMVYTLSVGHGCRLRKEIARYGMIVHHRPPYYVRGTSTFPEPLMQKEHKDRKADFGLSEMTPYWFYHPYGDHLDICREKPEGDPLSHPLSYVTIDFSKGGIPRLSHVAEFLKEQVSFDFTVHVVLSSRASGGSARIERKAIIELISGILKANPFISIKIVLECGEPAWSPGNDTMKKYRDFAREIYASLSFHKNYLDDRNLFWNFPGARRVPWSREVYWLLPRSVLPAQDSFREAGLRLMARLEAGGDAEIAPDYFKSWLDLFISFSEYPSGQGIMNRLEELRKMRYPGQHLVFSSLGIQRIWEELIGFPASRRDLRAMVFSAHETIAVSINRSFPSPP